MKIALISSVGGHLTELLKLADAVPRAERFWVVNDAAPGLPVGERAYRISHAERDAKVAWNLFECAAIFAREKPDLMLSTGAGPAVPAAVVARAAGIPVIYVEPSSAVTELTMTGRLMRRLANRFYVQWQSLLASAPWASYDGGLL